jgi:hypothetical protein
MGTTYGQEDEETRVLYILCFIFAQEEDIILT